MPRDDQLAVLFPGQGSQTPGMRADVERFHPRLIGLAQSALKADPFERVDQGTQYAQPAIFCAALAGWRALRSEFEPGLMAGHSLGEIAALVAAGALSEEDGLFLVCERGKAMKAVARASRPGGMVAVKAGREQVAGTAHSHGLTVANDNAPKQVVLSGDADKLDDAERELAERGMRATRLAVDGAFHSPAMEAAVERFKGALERVVVREPQVPVISGVTAEPFDDVRRRLAQALCRPVRWRDVLAALHQRGARRYVETGPGKVLTGLVRRSLDGVEAQAFASEAARA